MAGQHRKGVVQQRANLEDKIAELKLKLDDVRRKERESFGRLCEKVGLMDVAISAADLEAALRASTEGAFGDGT
jgi:homospermidine synthase